MAGALKRYRVMAYITGISLIILVLVMMPLRYIGGNAQPSELFSPFHGAMYMLYVMLAGCIPFVSFVVERRITAKAREALAT